MSDAALPAAMPKPATNPLTWMREHLFGNPFHVLLTVLVVWFLAMSLPALLDWALLHAVFHAKDVRECQAIDTGACWAFVGEKHRLILFGLYPYDEQWRPLLVVILLVALVGVSCIRAFWNRWLVPLWLVGMAAVGVLMWGGVFGLSYVENARWGGLPLTMILAFTGMAVGFPLGVLLALGRRSELPAIRAISIVYIELIRGVPAVSLLFMASVMLPLLLPEGMNIDKLLRAQIALILYASAYLAEVVRGGLQSLPKGQYEAADALGLTYWQKQRLIILPQALSISIPSLVNTLITVFKDTSLVVIIGLYDLMNAAKAAIVDPAWRGSAIESYVFIAAIYFVFCFFMSKYSQSIERRLDKEQHPS
ncbi:MAG TPA: amino acid ABC transporter permease [Alphaproteobacteria bacterium]|jgi:general L-amino acid transport system permease protein